MVLLEDGNKHGRALALAGTPSVCEDADACDGTDSCDPATGCANVDAELDCDDGNACTKDSCDNAKGCVHNDQDGATCDDNNACTENLCDAPENTKSSATET